MSDRTTNDPWIDLLSEYLDGELEPARSGELERHLRDCSQCSTILDELMQVAQKARTLEDRPPVPDLWPGIAARIGAEALEPPPPVRVVQGNRPASRREKPRRERRFSFTLPQLVAAGVMVAFLSAGAAWMLRSLPESQGGAGALVRSQLPDDILEPAGTRHERSYDVAMAELRRALQQGRGSLDSTTVRVLEQNLALIERSIDQARRALAADPGNPYLRRHLEETMRRKLELLRRATLVASAR